MKKLSKKLLLVLLPVGLAATLLLNSSFADDYFEVSKNLDIFATLFKEVNLYYVDEIKPGDLMKKGIDGMLETLDPYTNYIPESDIEDYRFMTTGQYGGVGALIRKRGDYVAISEPYEGFPAHKSGLMAGDLIIEVDGKSAKGKNTEDISKMLKGQAGTTVKVVLERPGESKRIEKELTRQEIKINSVPYYGVVGKSTGYIKLTGFTDNAGGEVKEAFLALKEKNKITSLILDLRGNPGGLLQEAINISNIFVEKGVDVVMTKGKVEEWRKTYKALNAPVDTEIPIVVLVNSGSASASEIVSGSLQDLDRAVVVGQRSFGKGLVQTTRNLSYNSKLKVTTAKYYIPSGRCIQALDYSHRNPDGSVGKVPDSLITQFKTKNGRIVYDGGGIKPDITTEVKKYPKIAVSLENKALIFDYATQFRRENEKIGPAKEFRLSDGQYQTFCDFLKGKDYDYLTQTDRELEKLKEIAEKEKYFSPAEKEFEALKQKMGHSKTEDLQSFKDDVKRVLEGEIVTRYYYQKGRIEWALGYDDDIKKALEILEKPSFYADILSGKYKEPEPKKEEASVKKKTREEEEQPEEQIGE